MFDNNSAVITANGQDYTSWQSVMVRREFGNGVPVFEFSPVEGAYGDYFQNLALDVGDSVTITLSGQLALTGVVNARTGSMDHGSHEIVIAGRSITGAAADSSVKVKPGSLNGYTLQQAGSAILQPFNVNFIVQDGGSGASMPFAKIMPRPGEFAHQILDRLTKMRACFLSGDQYGNLIASKHTTNSSSSATFAIGKNIISIRAHMENQGVAGAYNVLSQTPGSDQQWPSRAYSASLTQPAGQANVINTLIAEMPATSQELTMRAEHEAAVSAWAAFTCTIEVNGWLDPNGSLWDPLSGMRVSVYAPGIFPKAPYLVECGIQAVTFKQDRAGGSTTTLDLTLPSLLSGAATSGASVGPSNAPSKFSNVSDPTAQPDPVDTSSTSA